MWVEVHEKLLKMQSTPEVDCTFFNVWWRLEAVGTIITYDRLNEYITADP
jgi:hypothetical protein